MKTSIIEDIIYFKTSNLSKNNTKQDNKPVGLTVSGLRRLVFILYNLREGAGR